MDEEARADTSGATVTVRLIRSFEYRNIKYVVKRKVMRIKKNDQTNITRTE